MSNANNTLIELGTEELPPKALRALRDAFADGIAKGLEERGIGFDSIRSFATPRRLAVIIGSLADKQADREEQKLGPAVAAARDKDGNPTKAATGFAKGCGVAVDELQTIDTPKGERLGWVTHIPGQSSDALLALVIEQSLAQLPIPKRMRWGARRDEFVRPVHWLMVLSGDRPVPMRILGLDSANGSRGHRFHCDRMLSITHADNYESILRDDGFVLADLDIRREQVRDKVSALAKSLNGNAVIDDDLLDEVTALVEWPVPLAGSFDEEFLEVPREALVSSMKSHQKYFHMEDSNGNLLPQFITVANIESREPERVIQGNERVIRPRLADARFFWEQDLKTPLEIFCERLNKIVFQKELGTVYEKCERVAAIAEALAPLVSAEAADCRRAAVLCKADLVSDMVQEFADMQGIAGSHYARRAGENESVSRAIQEHYLPRFAGDALPADGTGSAVAIADRIDTLCGIFGIGQAPTGSRDPFALRRASLGVLRILLENELDIDLRKLIDLGLEALPNAGENTAESLLAYMIERLRGLFEDQGNSAGIFNAVASLHISHPLDFQRRLQAVARFAELPAAEALAAANKRVGNLLQKTGTLSGPVQNDRLVEDAERELAAAIATLSDKTAPLLAAGDYEAVLQALAELREPVDAFFDNVMVMADDLDLQQNRLRLLRDLKGLFLQVADVACLQQS